MGGLLLLSLILVFLGAGIAPVLHRYLPKLSPWLLSIIPLSSFTIFLVYTPVVITGKAVMESYKWVDALGFNFKFHLDGLSLLFSLLISGIGMLIVIYGGSYLANDRNLSKFYSFLFLFMGSMMGVVLSDNIFSLFIFWELTSLSSYLLIGFKHGYEDSRKSALQALLVTGSGGLALLAGLIMVSFVAGSPNISEWSGLSGKITASPHFGLILTLLLLGAVTKSAQFPFHFWLPSAMAAPAPVSAYLHSATMVKAGVYILARFNPYFEDSQAWQIALTSAGGLTMIFASVYALFHSDLKKILAYTTVSALGLMIFFIGIGTPKAIQGVMAFILAHAMYKGGLFMIAGNIDHSTGLRNVTKLSGLFPTMKVTGIAALLTSFSMAGFPFMMGFLSKELLYESALKAPQMAIIYTIFLFITSAIFVYLAILTGWKIFFLKSDKPALKTHDASIGMYIGPLILGIFGLISGIIPAVTVEGLLSKTAMAASSSAGGMKLYLWHGFNPVLGISIITLLAGWGLYKISGIFEKAGNFITITEKFGPEAIYDKSWEIFLHFADVLSRFVQSGYLRYYIMIILSALITSLLFPLWHYKLLNFNSSLSGVGLYEILLALMVASSVFFVIKVNSRLAAIAILGFAGYGIAVFFSIYGAPDLAMTQFLIETLTVAVFMYVLYRLPGYIKMSPGLHRYRDAAIALAGGITLTAVMLLVTNYPLTSELKTYFAENSYILARGRNVVNVILVDFRALDTMGEITVLAIAALGVFAMMKLRLSKRER